MPKKLNTKNYIDELARGGVHIDVESIASYVAETAVMKQMKAFLTHIDEKGLKLTARGNLPQKVVKEIVEIEPDLRTQFMMKISKRFIEDEQVSVQRIRNLCEVAKLVRLKQGKMIRGKEYEAFMNASPSEQFVYLYISFGALNFGYFDRHQEEELSSMIQYHFLQTIRDMEKMYRTTEVYLQLFYDNSRWMAQEIEQQIEPRGYRGGDAFDAFSDIVEIRLLKNFFVLFGFVVEREVGEGLIKEYEVEKTELLECLLSPVMRINSDMLLTPSRMKTYMADAKKSDIEMGELQSDMAFMLTKCISIERYNKDEIVEILLSKYKAIGTRAERLKTLFGDIGNSIEQTVLYFTRLEVKGGKEGDTDRFKQFIDALYLFFSKEKPRNIFGMLNNNSFVFMEYLFRMFGLDSRENNVDKKLQDLLGVEVSDDVNDYIVSLLYLDKKSKKLKRTTKEFEMLTKECLMLMVLAVMSLSAFIRDEYETK